MSDPRPLCALLPVRRRSCARDRRGDRSARITLLVVVAIALGACAARYVPTAADRFGALEHGGLTRSYFVHVPPQYDATRALPLVLALHGGGGRGRDAARLSGLNAEADRSGFFVAYPDGVDGHWNDGRGVQNYRAQRDDIDDVGFLVALIDQLARHYLIDRERVYVTGASNGAFMTNRLACERAERFAAIAPVIGSMSANLAATCRPARAMPVLLINGTDDELVPWNGAAVRFGRRELGAMLPVPELVQFWVRHNGCDGTAQERALPDLDPHDGTRAVLERYDRCRAGSAVALYRIEGGGHTWPGGLQYLPQWLVGRVSRDLDANRAIWEFFAAHRREP